MNGDDAGCPWSARVYDIWGTEKYSIVASVAVSRSGYRMCIPKALG